MAEDSIPEGKGWLCFTCGNRFTTWSDASEHFGRGERDGPYCVDPLRADEAARLAEVARLRAELAEEREAAQSAEERLDYWSSVEAALKKTFGTADATQLCRRYDEATFVGAVYAAVIAEMRKLQPSLVDIACRIVESRELTPRRRAELAALRVRADALANVVSQCAWKFKVYEEIHAAKGSSGELKARTNAEWRKFCEDALEDYHRGLEAELRSIGERMS